MTNPGSSKMLRFSSVRGSHLPDKYSPQVQYFAYMHFAALPSCVSSLLSTIRLFQAFLGYAECFFCHTKHFSAMLSHFLLCQALFFHADHLLPLPSMFLLC